MKTENNMVTGNENVETTGETEISEAGRAAGGGRTGKIGRLPQAIRQALNQRLQEGHEGQAVLDWLNGLPEVQAALAAQFQGSPIGKMNLSRWRHSGYKSWQTEQRAQGAVASMLEQSAGLKETAQEGLADPLTLVLTARMALELERLDAAPESEQKTKDMRALIGNLGSLQRGNFRGERLRVEREKLGFRRELRQKEREAEFWQWIEKKENRDKILNLLLTPEQKAEEIARRKEEKKRKISLALGIH